MAAGKANDGAQGHTESAEADGTTTATVAGGTGAESTATTETGAGQGDTTTSEDGAEKAAGATPAATDGKTEEQPGDTGSKAESKVPEQYSFTVPDEGKVYVDERTTAHIEKIARQAGWSNEEAQAALEEHIGTMRSLSDEFLAQTKADTEYGGERLGETQRLALKAIDRVRPTGHARRDSFLTFLHRFGGTNHIEVVSFLADLGKLMAEDAPGRGTSDGGTKRTAEQVLYGPKT
jgi:hypothetical protein